MVNLTLSYSYSEFYGTRCTEEQFQRKLAKYSTKSVLKICSLYGALLDTTGLRGERRVWHAIVVSSFPPSLSDRIIADSSGSRQTRTVVHRLQLLYLARQALLQSNSDGEDPTLLPFLGDFGDLLLMANELLQYDLPMKTLREVEASVLTNFLAISDYLGPRLADIVVRSEVSMEILAKPCRENDDFVNFVARFESSLGLALEEYRTLCLVAVTKYERLHFEDVPLKEGLIDFTAMSLTFPLTRQWIAPAVSSGSSLDAFLDELGATIEELREITSKNVGTYDFTVFRRKPLILIDDVYYPADLRFLAEKLETGPFWHVHGRLADKDRERLFSMWGTLFENYVSWLLQGSVDGHKNRFYPSPEFHSDKAQVCDAIVQSEISAAFIECKGGFLSAKAKYGGDPEFLVAEIFKKFVGTRKARKGVEQLAYAITRLFTRGSTERVAQSDLSKVRTVFPVLVIREEIGSAPDLNRRLNIEFGKLIDRKRLAVHVESLFCLSAGALQHISAYLQEARLTHILDARKAEDKNLFLSFWLARNQVLTSLGNRMNPLVTDRFKRIMQDIAQRVFPDQFSSDDFK